MFAMEHMAASSSTGTSSGPTSLDEWMKSALPSKNFSIECAVDLSWMLTKHLCEAIASSGSVTEEHITAKNVMIYAAPPSSSELCDILQTPLVVDARFRFDAEDGCASPLSSKDDGPRSRKVCAALGRTLLGIFAMANLSSPAIFDGMTDDDNFDPSLGIFNDTAGNENSDLAAPPAEKRRAMTSPHGCSPSTTEESLLLSMGMPMSICRLVCDLINAEGEPCSDLAVVSAEEALWDLTRMKTCPRKFLYDRTCPQRALDDACLFNDPGAHFIGREGEVGALATTREKVSAHVRAENNEQDSKGFLCEAAFLSGYAGSGKSSILKSVIDACHEEQWFVLGCKFDERATPHTILAWAFNDFFGKWGATKQDELDGLNSPMLQSFDSVCRHIFETMDDEGLSQLSVLVPNFANASPQFKLRSNSQDQDGISSMDKVGSAKKRLRNLFHILFDALCSAERPVLFTLDDLQWSESSVMEDVMDFVIDYVRDMSRASSHLCRRGLFIVGTYRNNEVEESDDLIKRINSIKRSGRANVTMLTVHEMSKLDINKLVSEKLCLPCRYTRELAHLVHAKTRGNPFFVIQFLRSIVQNNMLTFSVKSRRWTWDCLTVDLQMISDGVAELLVTRFDELSPALMQVLEILSCLGSQVEGSLIDAIDSEVHMLLSLAIKEGIVEKAGPLYRFTHDIIQQTIYKLIPRNKCMLLHKMIGSRLLKFATNNPKMHLRAMGQINIYCNGGSPNLKECLQFASSNATAAKFAIASSSFDQSFSYINMGLKLLRLHENQHWETQYQLSLHLFEMSASVSCMNGDIAKMTTCVDEILSHSKTFDDSLKALSLRIKILASSSKFEEVRINCFAVLSNFGEVFPHQVTLPLIMSELSAAQTILRDVTIEKFRQCSPMTDKNKLNAMKFLNMLCMYSIQSKPMLLPLACCRMVKLTIEFGFCDDSIVGLATVGLSVFHFLDDIQLASRIGKISEALVEESPNKHVLKSRLCHELVSGLKALTEPRQSVLPLFLELYNSAMFAGDIESAMICRWSYCGMLFWIGATDLSSASMHLVKCIKEAEKYQQTTVLYGAMSNLNACLCLSGRTHNDIEVDVKSFADLNSFAERANMGAVVWQVFNYRLAVHFWMREYREIAELSKRQSEKHPSSQQKRILNTFRTFYEGIAYLNLARDTMQAEWEVMGKKAVVRMSQLESMSKWNFGNKAALLQAELHYLEGDLKSAEAFYKASIQSAHDHKFIHEEALAHELYGIFCIENHMIEKGSNQLQGALDMYIQWGATKKADELQIFIGQFDPSSLNLEKITI